ncbi:PREDICTED: 21 kDa protein-like [Nicotiana attenuata]|uniref:21 kDa protein n=1 Tax=Nicotiana attenuata TaxID=49451 RepID=A0A1J6JTJ9_NICAT|nr:PREDICTED: 21 kDa protein-like [Nicotiana attenuata]OIT20494.1 21 kda protein [Nicotiana attenuata]
MGNFLSLHLLILFFSLQCFLAYTMAKSAAMRSNPDAKFIRVSCKATLYPVLCVQCLSAYANTVKQSEQQLARAALSVSLARAKSTTIFVSKLTRVRGLKPREKQAVKDCFDTMSDSVDQINKSIPELGQTGHFAAGQDFMWHVSNVQTWVSAAMTDENTCLDGFSGPGMNGNVKAVLRSRILHLAQVTSNALALVNRFADRHRPRRE